MTKILDAISRTIVLAILVIIIIAAIAGAYVAISKPTSSTSTSTSSTSSTSTVSTVSTASSSTSTSNKTLVIDDSEYDSFLLGTPFYPDDWQDSVYQYLVTFNATAERAGTLQIVPDLAITTTVSPNGMNYTFGLRQGINYTDGTPFNAYDVWADFYIQYYMFANASNFMFGVTLFNFSAVNFGPATLQLMNQTNSFTSPSSALLSIMMNSNWPVYVKNQYTIVYQLSVPYSTFENLLTGPINLLFDPTFIMEHGGPGTPSAPNSYFYTNPPPGTGPYEISSVVLNEGYTFVQNPNYWGDSLTPAQIAANAALDPGSFQTIVVNTISDPTVRYLDLTSGRVQMSLIEGSDFQLLLASNNSAYNWVTFGPSGGATLSYFAMNTQSYPTNITDVRLAIVHAVNITQIIDQAVFGYGTPFFGPEAPIYGALYNPTNYSPYSYNLTLAENYLAQAGFPNGKGFPTISIVVTGDYPWQETTAELIQADLAQINIQLNINVVTRSYYTSYYYGTSYGQYLASPPPAQLIMVGAGAYSPDFIGPADFIGQFLTNVSSFANAAVYSSNATYAAYESLLTSNNVTLQTQLMAAAEKQIYNDAPYDWLFLCNLYSVDGSYVYNTQVIHSYYIEPNLGGDEGLPLLNTIS